jgi:serine/threonine-protein kinase
LVDAQQAYKQQLDKARDDGRITLDKERQAHELTRAKLAEVTTALQQQEQARAEIEHQLEPVRADLAKAEAVPKSGAAQPQWALFENKALDFSIRYPTQIFAADASDGDGEHKVFLSKDGKAKLVVMLDGNGSQQSLTAYRKALREGTYGGASFDYEPTRDNWFVLSGSIGDFMFYDRVTFACNGRFVHRWRLTYPVSQRLEYDGIVEKMHRTYVNRARDCRS